MINTELITEEEFLKALEVCRKYKNQLNKEMLILETKTKTSLSVFLERNIDDKFFKVLNRGATLATILKNTIEYSKEYIFIEDISDRKFLRVKGAGKVSLAYFKEMKKHFNIN